LITLNAIKSESTYTNNNGGHAEGAKLGGLVRKETIDVIAVKSITLDENISVNERRTVTTHLDLE
jgi:hypothetical protein